MKRELIAVAMLLLLAATSTAQEKKADTVIVALGKTSKVVFTIEDRSDLDILKHYNFQNLFEDILSRLERNDTTGLPAKAEETIASEENRDETTSANRDSDTTNDTTRDENRVENDEDDDNNEWNFNHGRKRSRFGRTWQSFNFDLGTNNYVTDGTFPNDSNKLHAVRPWGSWYLAFSSIQRTRVSRNFFLEWGASLSWYNFKFEKDNVLIQKNDNGVEFVEDLRNVSHVKSKLTASYINIHLIPVLDFGDHNRKARVWKGYQSEFRIGVGPYLGYRISSWSKMMYKEDGHREKEKNRDSFYLNNLRYGARLQLGFRSTDLFFNYDLNELFAEAKGPKLNAFSFGIIF